MMQIDGALVVAAAEEAAAVAPKDKEALRSTGGRRRGKHYCESVDGVRRSARQHWLSGARAVLRRAARESSVSTMTRGL